MKRSFFLIALVGLTMFSFAQKKKITTSATLAFDASTKLDPLAKAENKTTIASLNTKTGEIAFETVVKNFTFSNPKMQEHFNGTTWMDSDKFPAATFKGAITNPSAVKFNADGSYTTTISGDLTIHGVTKPVTTSATIVVNGKTVTATSAFEIKVADFGINGPSIAAGKVATDPKITVAAEFK